MTRDEAVARARAVVCANPGCDDTEHAMLRGLLDALDDARANASAWVIEELERRRERDAAIARAELAERRARADASCAATEPAHDSLGRGFPRDDAASRLGISVRSLIRLEESGKIRTIRIGHRVIVPASEIARLLAEGTSS